MFAAVPRYIRKSNFAEEMMMGKKFRVGWQQIKKHPVLSIGITAIVVIVLGVSIILVVNNGTGFDAYSATTISKLTSGTTNPIVTSTVVNQPGKTLWDWLNLLGVLAIPAVVGLGAAWYTAQQGKVNDRENTDNQRENALHTYIDKMSDLLLHEKLRESQLEDEVRKIARVWTLTVLPRLDDKRKGSVLQFLHEAKLIDKGKSIVILDGADFSHANLRDAYLDSASLSRANFSQADFRQAWLQEADLTYANLEGADIRGSRLRGADLSRARLSNINMSGISILGKAIMSDAVLRGANMSNSDLRGVDLNGAELTGANLSDAYLRQANLCNADLSEANLRNARLWDADLSRANLEGADLTGADMKGGDDMVGANLERANLGRANLKGANFIKKQLDQVSFLQGATMPDGSKHP
jgi:uncharacterized protein YjbI with pentapeptide repeats